MHRRRLADKLELRRSLRGISDGLHDRVDQPRQANNDSAPKLSFSAYISEFADTLA